ncbi:MAG: flagellar basal body protein [Thermoleophilia bacterium]
MFDDITTVALTQAMHGANLRQSALAQNLANADTPGYQRVDVNFEGALAAAVEQDRAKLVTPKDQPPIRPGKLDGTGSNSVFGETSVFGDGNALEDTPAGVSNGLATAQIPFTTAHDGATTRADGSTIDPDHEMAQMASNQLTYNTVTSLLNARFGELRTAIKGT